MLDEKILFFLNNLSGQSGLFDAVIVFLADYLQYFLGIVFLWLLFCSRYPQKKKYVFLFTVLLSILVACFGIAAIIHYFYHHPRPFLVYPVNQIISASGSSFPSGHATFFFALAVVVFLYNKKIGGWFLAAALLISLARVYVGVHYPADILAGALIGIFTGWVVWAVARKVKLVN